MVKQTNELWVIHRFETEFIQLGRRRRRCSIILIYDYVSRFILDGQICFLTESTIRSRRMQVTGLIHEYLGKNALEYL